MILLRPWHVRDADDVLATFRSEDLAHQAPPMTDLAAARRYCLWLAADQRLARAIEADGRVVGNVMASSIDRDHRTAWISYWLDTRARGQGLATRALGTLSARLLSSGLERLELGTRLNNPASIAVAERAGFVREGVERAKLRYGDQRFDVATYARLTTDPIPDIEELPWR